MLHVEHSHEVSIVNFMFVKHFSKSGHRKMGDRVEGWNIPVSQQSLESWFVARWWVAEGRNPPYGFWVLGGF
jgi:hypothetical protein